MKRALFDRLLEARAAKRPVVLVTGIDSGLQALIFEDGDNEGGLGHIATKFTGFGVRYTMSAILDENLFRASL